MEFTNQQTKSSYEMGVAKDRSVLVPGDPQKKRPTYDGKLSAIPPEVAEAIFEQGSNLVTKKKSPPKEPASAK